MDQEKKVYLVVLKRTFSIHSLKKRENLKEIVITLLVLRVQLEILSPKSLTSDRIIDLERLKEAEDLVKILSKELTINLS